MIASSPAPVRKGGKMGNKGQNIKVFVRVRPMNETESKICIECPPTNREVVVQERPYDKFTKKFTFDRVFPTNSKQMDVYKHVARPLVDEVLDGFNCTIFAYGQTGTGKTYTMEGGLNHEAAVCDDNLHAGIIPRCINQLFDELRIQKVEFTMRVSFLELYNEEVFDLLSAHDDLSKLRLYEDGARKGSCIIQGLEEVVVGNKSDVYNIIEKGSAKRQTAATLMNAHSSRSHTVFTVTVHMKENDVDGYELMKIGKLHLVDLAGSENIGRSGAVDKRAREAGNINQSLLTLGRVITSLVEKTPHIPYRESKLTRLLQDALGGRTKTSIIATISPASINLEETLSTLDYACRAKNIQNRPEVNQKLHKKELIGEYAKEIEKLRRDVMAMREKNGVYLANENYEEMVSTIDKQNEEITQKLNQIRHLETELENQLELFERVNEQLASTSSQLDSAKSEIVHTKENLECTQKLLATTAVEKEEQEFLVQAHVETENTLQTQANNLLNVAHATTDDVKKLHDKLDRKRKVEATNEEISVVVEKELEDKVSSMHSSISAFKDHYKTNSANIIHGLDGGFAKSFDELDGVKKNVSSMKLVLEDSMKKALSVISKKTKDSSDRSCSFSDQMLLKLFENREAMREFVVSLLDGYINLSQTMEDLQKIVDTSVSGCKKQAKEMSDYCVSVHDEGLGLINSMEESIESVKNVPSLVQRCMETKSAALHSAIEGHYEKMKRFAHQILEDAENGELLNEFPLLPEREKKELLSIDHATQKVNCDLKKLESISECHKKKAMEYHTQANDYSKENLSQINSELDKVKSALGSLKLSTSECGKNQDLHTEETRKIFKEFEETEKSCSESDVKDIDDYSKTFFELSASESDRILERFSSLNGEMEKTLNVYRENRSVVTSEIEEFLDDHNEQLQECGDSIRDYFNNQIAKDIPTGMTPGRTDYTYPQTLAATSPHERILGRYRRRFAASRIPLPNFSAEEKTSPDVSSNDSSIASTKSESTPDINNGKVEEFALPAVPSRQMSADEIRRPGSALSRSSSTNSIPENSKENQRVRSKSKKRELRQPSVVAKLHSQQEIAPSTRSRRILGPYN